MSISSSPTFACTGHLHVHAQTYAPSIRSLTCAPIDTGQACASTHTSSAFAARRLAPPPRGLGCQAERIEVAQPPQNCSPLPHRGQARAPHRRSPENHDHFRTPAPSLYCGCTGAAGEASGESRSGSPRPANRPDHMNQLQRPIAICDTTVAIKPPIFFRHQERGIWRVAIVGHVGQANVLEARQLLCLTMSFANHVCSGFNPFVFYAPSTSARRRQQACMVGCAWRPGPKTPPPELARKRSNKAATLFWLHPHAARRAPE